MWKSMERIFPPAESKRKGKEDYVKENKRKGKERKKEKERKETKGTEQRKKG